MMKRAGLFILGCGMVVLLTGCQTTGWEHQRQQDERWVSEVSELRISMQRMEHRLADLAREQDVLGHDVQALRFEVNQQATRSDTGLTALAGRLEEQARIQSALRKELTDDLSARMAAIMQANARAAASTQRAAAPRARSEVGYEHEVRPGETLSEIARAYGVSSQAILDANQLRNPDVLRVGQKLFIPERGR